MKKPITYSKLATTLSKLGAQLNAAETHGMLTGMLSISREAKSESWAPALLENLDCSTPNKTQWEILSSTGTKITQDFADGNFEFDLLLPPDNTALEERVDALCFWCRGYLSGLGLVGVTSEDLANDTVKELVQDISQIAHVKMETDESEEDEDHYMELVEYVRVAVQNIQVELQSAHSGMLH